MTNDDVVDLQKNLSEDAQDQVNTDATYKDVICWLV